MSTASLRTRHGVDAALGAAYFGIASATIALTRFEGGVAYLWIATALLLPALAVRPRRQWPGLIGWSLAGSALATGLFGFGWALALPLAVVNVGEAVLGAWLLRQWNTRSDALDSVGRLALFVAAAGIIAPIAAGLAGAAVVHAIAGVPFLKNWANWAVGHALGTLSFTPIFSLFLTGVAARWYAHAGRAQIAEAVLLMTLTATVALAVFGQNEMPLLFLPILPVILATFRLGRLGAAGAIVFVALIGGALTAAGSGPVHLIAGHSGSHVQFFQFYLAATVLTALPVAADLTRRREIHRRLRESEARLRESEAQLRLLTDNSTDIVLNLSAQGIIRFASPSIAQLGGYSVEQVIGRNALDLIVAEDHNRVAAAHIATLSAPDTTQIVEYRARTGDGSIRWFETHSRCVVDGDGTISGVVCAIRDVSHRKSVEAELARAAATDPLTGLANRRAFDAALQRQKDGGGAIGGHVALFDLDHFKGINDRFGHAVGDAVLQTFARVARASVREGDLVARLGGEEFGIVLANAGRDQAQLVCDRLRAAFAATPTPAGAAPVLVTASAGVAAIRAAVPVADTLEQADAALYEAKRAGRNRLLLAA